MRYWHYRESDGTRYESAIKHVQSCYTALKSLYIDHNTQLVIREGYVALVLWHNDIAHFMPDGTTVVYNAGYSQTTNMRLRAWADIRIASTLRSLKGPRWLDHDSHTPSKVWKCRTCHGHKRMSDEAEAVIAGLAESAGHDSWWYRHVCYRCDGTGRADYGSKPVEHPVPDGTVFTSNGRMVLA